MAHLLPLGKLFGVFLKQLSKPVASRIKERAKTHPTLSNVCAGLGEGLHRVTVRIFRSSRDADTAAEVKPLKREKAVERGAELIGETFVFAVVGGVTANEVINARKESAARAVAKEQRSLDKAQQRQAEYAKRDARLDALEAAVAQLQRELAAAQSDHPAVEPVSALKVESDSGRELTSGDQVASRV
mmetsp:Transcript_5687/g.15194  ORF Transcript_5687/g.15194 Transcript_5687/m.15194 type:complete len:187 (+) Transcript_5687:333-893(+)